MDRNLKNVDELMELKYRITCDKEYLLDMLGFLKRRIQKLEKVYRRQRWNTLSKKIKKMKLLAGCIVQSIEATEALVQPLSDQKLSRAFSKICKFFIKKIHRLQDCAHVFSRKFVGIRQACTDMVSNNIQLQNLVRA